MQSTDVLMYCCLGRCDKHNEFKLVRKVNTMHECNEDKKITSDYHINAIIEDNVNPVALRTAKTLWSFGHSECNKVK